MDGEENPPTKQLAWPNADGTLRLLFFFLRGARPKKKKINLGAQKKMGYIFFLAIPLAHKFMLLTNCFQ